MAELLRGGGPNGRSAAPGANGRVAPRDTERWARQGAEAFSAIAGKLSDRALRTPSLLPGWTRAHVIAHVASNADALRNLAQWAATGVETPMYANQGQRDALIDAGARLEPSQLRSWLESSSSVLEAALTNLDTDRQHRLVRTSQGRVVPAVEIWWLRAREVWVHTVDLDSTVSFEDLPNGFVRALVSDIAIKRGMTTLPAGTQGQVAAYLAGRPHRLTGVPELGTWL